MLAAYSLAMGALEPLAPTILRRRAKAGKEDPGRLGERLGHASAPRPPGDLVWLHGASVGETLSLLPLVEALDHERPDLALLVTSGTVTSARLLGQRLPPGVIHQYAPLDAPGAARRFLAHWRPSLGVFVESELWPNLLRQAKASGARLALLGARLSASSARGWTRAPKAARTLLQTFDLILAQDAMSRQRIEQLGGPVADVLDLKQAGAPLPCDDAELARLKAEIGGRPVLLAASTHPGEDDLVAQTFAALDLPTALLVLVPRHPERGSALAAALRAQGWRVAQRSRDERLEPFTQIYLADTLGELGLMFRLAQVVVMGGGFAGDVGGHNPLEAARLALPIVTGPDVANHREAYAGLLAEDGARLAPTPAELQAQLAALMADSALAHDVGQRAQTFAMRGDGQLGRALDRLRPLLPGPST
ncbi:MAG TPA: 3-deoxy-D-manno-octulosonic acid transferase [Caulobacteraceae bacterium]|nr:3-deoxy-D-manno-octulosonic acid transferase [Caulobacteraceae bacterium]